ncbi:hypothetical protein P280DRAFT_63933 [Massarina eburnea CBS 473.64]|uniref:Uncharacterized protein n=1 Tax=Massarina eburnea CBS 473.64 TaxID=1395130 RepID=A0A6A6RUP1_9PLEO|nr:hypothetical protein P280DRAFT_63933 [Massarina eburnea CBS 473.64]
MGFSILTMSAGHLPPGIVGQEAVVTGQTHIARQRVILSTLESNSDNNRHYDNTPTPHVYTLWPHHDMWYFFTTVGGRYSRQVKHSPLLVSFSSISRVIIVLGQGNGVNKNSPVKCFTRRIRRHSLISFHS